MNGKAHHPIERAKNGTFAPGHRGGPGRPVGSRNRLAESFLADLQKQWAKSGKKALERTATDDPVAFTKIVASLMPREMLASVINVNANIDARLLADVQTFAGELAGIVVICRLGTHPRPLLSPRPRWLRL